MRSNTFCLSLTSYNAYTKKHVSKRVISSLSQKSNEDIEYQSSGIKVSMSSSFLSNRNLPSQSHSIADLCSYMIGTSRMTQFESIDRMISMYENLCHRPIVMPLRFTKSLIDIFVQQLDPWRIEIVLRLFRKNIQDNQGDEEVWRKALRYACESLQKYHRSKFAITLQARIDPSIVSEECNSILDVFASKSYPKLKESLYVHDYAISELHHQSRHFLRQLIYLYQNCLKSMKGKAIERLPVTVSTLQSTLAETYKLYDSKVERSLHFWPHLLYRYVSFLCTTLQQLSKNVHSAKDLSSQRTKIVQLFSQYVNSLSSVEEITKKSSNDNAHIALYLNLSLQISWLSPNQSMPRMSEFYRENRDIQTGLIQRCYFYQIRKLAREGEIDLSLQLFSLHILSMRKELYKVQQNSFVGAVPRNMQYEYLYPKLVSEETTTQENLASADAALLLKDLYVGQSRKRGMSGAILDANLPNKLVTILRDAEYRENAGFISSWIEYLLHSSKYVKNNNLLVSDIIRSLYNHDNDIVYNAYVTTMCESRSPSSTANAVMFVDSLASKGVFVSADSFRKLIISNVRNSSDIDHGILLSRLEGVVQLAGKNVRNDTSVLKALFFANARQNNAFKCIQILRYLQSQDLRLPIVMYLWVIHTIYHMTMKDSDDWKIATNPLANCKWILRDLRQHRRVVTPKILAALLKLFSKASQLTKNRDSRPIINEAESFVSDCCIGVYCAPIKISEDVSSELIRACLLGNQVDEAWRIMAEYPKRYGYKVTCKSFEPLIFYHAVTNSSVNVVDDILTQMRNSDVDLSRKIVDAIVYLLISQGSFVDALDRIQEMFTQDRVKPSHGTLLRLLDASLKNNDEHEARRVVSVIEQLYTEEQREKSAVNTANISHFSLISTKDIESQFLPSSDYARDDNDPLSEYDKLVHDSNEAKISDVESKVFELERDYAIAVANAASYRRSPNVGPREYGALSHKSLQKRFQLFGLTL